MKEVDRDFFDLLSAFNDAGARYLIVGAHALAVHGRSRATKDLDVWVASDNDNAKRVYAALARFGAPLGDVRTADFTAPDVVFQIGVAPIRIDVMTTIDGVEFDDAWNVRTTIANKRAVGRPQDLADIAALGEEPQR